MKVLIVNADDYGRAPSVSAGIREAHRRGIVTSTTAMLNMSNVEVELLTAQRECPRLGLGVHLTLTAESPLLPPRQLPSLMALSDGQRFPTLAQFTAGAAGLNVTEIKTEWHAQIEKFMRVTGQAPTHLDSHHHASYARPALLDAMLALARDYQCAIRRPSLNLSTGLEVRCPDFFDERFYGAGATVATLLEIINNLPEGVTEVMCHPALPDEGLAALSSYNTHRAAELRALMDDEVRARVKAHGIELRSFQNLENLWKS